MLELWPEYENHSDILKKNVSKEIVLDNFNDIQKETEEFVYLINQEKHYFYLKRFTNGKIYQLDPILERPVLCPEVYLHKLNLFKKK